jgi:hypothetical protein
MLKLSKKKIEFDIILSYCCIFLSLILVSIYLINNNLMYIIIGMLLLFTCTSYLLLDRKKDLFHIQNLEMNKSLYSLLDILYFFIFCYSLISLYFRPNIYERPLLYFISIVILASLISLQILFLPSKIKYTSFVLLKIILISINIVSSQIFLYPDLVGVDPWWHRYFTQFFLNSGFLLVGESYSKLPLFHLLTGITSLVTRLDYKIATTFSISYIQIICLTLFIFLLGRFLFNTKVGLLAGLLVSTANYVILMSYWAIPQSFGSVFIPIIIYLIFKVKPDGISLTTLLYLIFMTTLILTHPLASLTMAILTIVFWLSFEVFKWKYNIKSSYSPFNTAILFTAAMFGWWMYASGHILILSKLLKWGFSLDFWQTQSNIPITYIEQYRIQIPFIDILFNVLGRDLFWIFSFIGVFYMISNKVKSKYSFETSLGGFAILGISFISIVSSFEILTYRWFYFTQILLSIPLAISFYLFILNVKSNSTKSLFMVSIVVTLSFLMILSPIANMDNPYFKDTSVRKAFTESELQSFQSILNFADKKIEIDPEIAYLTYSDQFPSNRISSIGNSFYSKKFNNSRDSIIVCRSQLRSAISGSENYITKLNYDPAQFLEKEGFSKIYNSGSVSALSIN